MKTNEKIEEKEVVEVCPLCGSEMEKGYIASRVIAWSNKKISNWSPAGLWGGEIIVSRGYPYLIINVEAYRCKKCKLIIFRYGEASDNPAEIKKHEGVKHSSW